MKLKKLFILGLDGASFELINSFSEQGIIPNITHIINNGYFSCLKSTIPPHTAPGWVSSLTGVNPGQHGIYQFWVTNAKSYEGRFMGSEDVGVPFVWDILNEFNISTGMVNIPMTHPPKPVNEYIITWPLYNTLKYCYPKELVHELLKAKCHFASDIVTMFQGDMNYINQAIEIVHKRFEAIQYLLKTRPTDFFMSVFTEIDRVSHFYWDYYSTNSVGKDAIKEIYRECDKVVGKILDLLDEDTILLIYSDHGFRKCQFDYYIQSYLMKEKLLTLREMSSLEKRNNNWYECEDKEGNTFQVDWDKTIAYMACPGSYGININLKYRQKNGIIYPEDYKMTCDTVVKLLKEINHPFKEKKLFNNVYYRDEIYFGKFLENAPDIILEPDDFEFMVHHKINIDSLYSKKCEQSGIHSSNGILLLYGKHLDDYEISSPKSLMDIAPTILYFYGINKLYNMEGKSILHVQEEDRCLRNSNTSKVQIKDTEAYYNEKEEIEIKARLTSLGYF